MPMRSKHDARTTRSELEKPANLAKFGKKVAPPETHHHRSSKAHQSAENGQHLTKSEHGMSAEQLYRVVYAAVRRRLAGDSSGFEDLVQEVLERALRGLEQSRFRGHAKITTWVSAIANNVAIDSIRTRERHGVPRSDSHPDLAEAACQHDLERQMEARSTLAELERLLGDLEPLTAEIILLHDIKGYDLTEIALLKQLSVAATQSRLVRGRKRLADGLRHDLGRQ